MFTLESPMLSRTDRKDSSLPKIFPQFEAEYCDSDYLRDVLTNRFCFNGESYDLGSEIVWLANPSEDVEWHILLHKFYYGVGLAEQYRNLGDLRYLDHLVALIESWIDSVPANYIATDVTGRRVQNWIYAWYVLQRAGALLPPTFEEKLLGSIAEQVEAILENLAPARNHRTLELYAVFLAAIAFPDHARARAWLEFARDEMIINIQNDLLPDGVHCELSSDYHHIVLKNYLLFYRLAKANGVDLPRSLVRRLLQALRFGLYVHRPDGCIPALSDSDSRSYQYLLGWGAELFQQEDLLFGATGGEQGKPPAASSAVFPHAGYCVIRSGWQRAPAFEQAHYLVFDSGPVGAGNHGHLDALSVEVAGYGRSLIVDPGRYSYDERGEINWRAEFRKTAAHNTVCIDSLDQAIYRQAGSRKKIFEPHPQTELVRADLGIVHPYVHGRTVSPNYDAVHDRHIVFVKKRYWWLVDVMRAATRHEYDQRFQLHPDAQGSTQLINHRGLVEVRAPRNTGAFVRRGRCCNPRARLGC